MSLNIARTHRGFLLVALLFLVTSALYSIVVPVFNAPDEDQHFEYIRFLAHKGRLPDQSRIEDVVSHEGFNPPLYYFMNALLLRSLTKDISDIVTPTVEDLRKYHDDRSKGLNPRIFPPVNPQYVKFGWGKGKNMFLTASEDRFPFQGSIRTIHLLRLFSVLLGAGTLCCIYLTALRFLGRPDAALLTAALAAFLPQFNFISGSLNNDNLVIFFSSLSLFFLTKLIMAEQMEKRDLLLLGLSLGLGLISKVNISSIAAVSTAAVAVNAYRLEGGDLKKTASKLLPVLAPAVLLSGWFFIRNMTLYGMNDPLGWKLRMAQNPDLLLPPELRGLFFRKVFFQRLFTSFFGQFDWLTVYLPAPFYWVYGLLAAAMPAGAALLFKDARRRFCLAVYLACVLLSLANLVILNFTFLSAQSRLLFPTLTVFTLLTAAGFGKAFEFLERITGFGAPRLSKLFMSLLFAMNLYALAGVVYPVYR